MIKKKNREKIIERYKIDLEKMEAEQLMREWDKQCAEIKKVCKCQEKKVTL